MLKGMVEDNPWHPDSGGDRRGVSKRYHDAVRTYGVPANAELRA